MKARSLVGGCVLALTVQAGFCATFQNLDFESPRFVPAPFASDGSFINAVLVGWVFYRGTNQFDELAYNYGIGGGLEGVTANLWDGFINRFYMFTNLVDGKYAVYFHQDYVNSSPFAIAQTATIPSEAKFLRFKAAGYTGFIPTLNGEVPPLVDRVFLGGVENPDAFFEMAHGSQKTYDISAFAGKDVELRLTLGYIPFFNYGDGILDSIELLTDYARFNPSSVRLGTNGLALSWVSIPSSKFQVELATNFPAIWQPISPPATSTNYTFNFTDTTITNQPSRQRFYRLRAVP